MNKFVGLICIGFSLFSSVEAEPVVFAAVSDNHFSSNDYYGNTVKGTYEQMSLQMPFVINCGDNWNQDSESSVAAFQRIEGIYNNSMIPQIIVPGDNDYFDYNPGDRETILNRFRKYLIKDVYIEYNKVLRLPETWDFRESSYSELSTWSYGNLQFIGLNVPNSYTADSINYDWIDYVFEHEINSSTIKGVVFFMHAPHTGMINYIRSKIGSRYIGLTLNGHHHVADFVDHSGGGKRLYQLYLNGRQSDWSEIEFNADNDSKPFTIRNHISSSLDNFSHNLNNNTNSSVNSSGRSSYGKVVLMDDFNNDNFDDIVISDPDFNGGRGLVTVSLSSDDQCGTKAGFTFCQGDANAPSNGDLPLISLTNTGAEPGDHFGHSLASGDFNNDGNADLVIGVPGEGIGSRQRGGAIHVLWGDSITGFSSNSELLYQGTAGIAGGQEAGDGFGSSLVAGDFNGDNYDDLVIGVPYEAPYEKPDGGAVHVLWGAADGFSTDNGRFIYQGQSGVDGGVESGDKFGAALAVGRINADKYDDLIIGAPGEAIGSISGCGAIHILFGAGNKTLSGGMYHQGAGFIEGACETGDAFGSSIVTGRFNNDTLDDIAVGIPNEGPYSYPNGGAVSIIWGGNSLNRSNLIYKSTNSISGRPESGDLFGSSLAAADFNGDGYSELVIGVPGSKNYNGDKIQVLWGDSSGNLKASTSQLYKDYPALPNLSDTSNFGYSLAVGNSNNDKHDDLIIGIPNENKIFMMHGSLLYNK